MAISSETEERTGSSTEPGGEVTVASNLPEGDAAGGAQGQSQTEETLERINYEVSETQRELVRGPGAIRRMTVAVMVDGVTGVAADGSRTWTARPEEELATLTELVAAAVGLDEARGDILTLKSLEFQPLALPEGTEASAGLLPQFAPLDTLSLVQVGVLALVALVLVLFVIRLILTSGSTWAALGGPASPLALPSVAGTTEAALDGEVETGFELPGYPAISRGEAGADDPATRLRRLIEERQAESIEILRGWMERDEERV